MVCGSRLNLCTVVRNDFVILLLGELSRLEASLSILDSVLVAAYACANTLALVVYGAAGNVVKTDDGSARGGFSASGFTNETEYLTIVDIKAYVIYRLKLILAELEILLEIFDTQ